jgi:exopolyphosphatase/guanosine-5'-triphosphate,3'-diphosphate pyrophosphatase
VRAWVDRLWSLPLAERRKIPGLPPPRADVMLTGAAIYEAVMQQFKFAGLRVTTRGLRFAALLDDPATTGS